MIFCILIMKKWLVPDFCQKNFFHIGHDEQLNDSIKTGSFVAVPTPQLLKDAV